MSPRSNRSRFLVNTVTSQTGSSMLKPTNQRKRRLYSSCSMSSRSAPNGVEDLEQQGAQQLLGGDRRSACLRVQPGKARRELPQHFVAHLADRPQRVVGRNPPR